LNTNIKEGRTPIKVGRTPIEKGRTQKEENKMKNKLYARFPWLSIFYYMFSTLYV